MRKLKHYFAILTIILTLVCISSCRRFDHAFVIENNTHFLLDSLRFDKIYHEIKPQSSIEFDYEILRGLFIWASPLYVIEVETYSDSTGIYKNGKQLLSFPSNYTRKGLNRIVIDYQSPSTDSNEFTITIIEEK